MRKLFCISTLLFAHLSIALSHHPDSCETSWSLPFQFSSDSTGGGAPRIITKGDSLFAIWGSQTPANGTIWYSISHDRGSTWTNVSILVPMSIDDYRGFHVTGSGDWIYVVWTGCNPCIPDPNWHGEIRLLRSSDFGMSWLPRQVLGRSYGGPIATLGSAVFINIRDSSFASRIMRSQDNGLTFNSLPTPPALLGTYQFDAFVASESGLHGLASLGQLTTGTDETYYWRSTNWGDTWEPPQLLSTIDNFTSNVWDVAAWGANDVYAVWTDGKYGGFFSGTILLRRSNDGGATFGPEQIISPNTAVFYSVVAKDNLLSIAWDTDEGANRSHIYFRLSRDNGATFCPQFPVGASFYISTAPDVSFGNSLVLVASALDSGSSYYKNFFTSNNAVTSVPLSEPNSLAGFVLEEPFPNPFNPATTISFSLPQPSFIQLKVFDILGREVAMLVNERRQSGRHSVGFDASRLPSGVYFYTIRAGDFVETKKLVLLR